MASSDFPEKMLNGDSGVCNKSIPKIDKGISEKCEVRTIRLHCQS